jgi:hypothetical protein
MKINENVMYVIRGEETKDSKNILHIVELHDLGSSPNVVSNVKFRKIRWGGNAAYAGFKTKRARPRWEDNINMNLIVKCIQM